MSTLALRVASGRVCIEGDDGEGEARGVCLGLCGSSMTSSSSASSFEEEEEEEEEEEVCGDAMVASW